jgi:hypothetical protein
VRPSSAAAASHAACERARDEADVARPGAAGDADGHVPVLDGGEPAEVLAEEDGVRAAARQPRRLVESKRLERVEPEERAVGLEPCPRRVDRARARDAGGEKAAVLDQRLRRAEARPGRGGAEVADSSALVGGRSDRAGPSIDVRERLVVDLRDVPCSERGGRQEHEPQRRREDRSAQHRPPRVR